MAMQPFLWGDSGEEMTPEQVKQRRRVAQALAQRAGDSSPVQHWTQGLARVTDGILSGMQMRDADNLAKANRDSVSGLKLFGDAPTGDTPPATGSYSPEGKAPAFVRSEGTTPNFAFDANKAGRAAYDAMVADGLQPHQAAGFLGNFTEESSLNPNAYNKNEDAIGFAQWRGPRAAALKQYAAANGGDFRDPAIQGRFAAHEMRTNPEYKGAWEKLQASKTPQEAADAVVHWEKPGGWKPGDATGVPSYNDRLNHAARAAQTYGARQADIPAPGANPAAIEGGGGGFSIPGAPAVAMDEEQTQALEAQITPAQMVPDTAPLPPQRPVMPSPADVPAPGAAPAQGTMPQPMANPNQDAVYRAMSDPNLSASAVAALSSPNRDAQLASIMQGNPETAQADPRAGVVAALMARGGPQQAYASLPTQSPTQAPVAAPAPPQAPVERVAQAMPPQAATPSASPAVQSVAQAMPQGQGQGRTVNIENAYAIASSPWATPQQKAQAMVAVKMWEQQQTRSYDTQKTAEQRAWEERKLREQRGYQVEDRNSNQGFQRGQTEEQRKFDQPYKDSASSVAQGNLDVSRERLTFEKGKQPTNVQEYEYAKSQGYGGSFVDFQLAQKKAGAQTINLDGGSPKQIFDTMEKSAVAAQSAVTGLASLQEARKAIQGGAILGAGADAKLGLQKLGAAFGLGDVSKIENTETFRSAIAPQVSAMMKATVGSTQISNADREFAAKAAGGDISLEPGSINRLLDIMERASNSLVETHQKRLDAVYPDGGNYGRERALFGVQAPAPAQPQEPPPSQNGAPVNGAKQAPDGNWYVPDPGRPGKYLQVQP